MRNSTVPHKSFLGECSLGTAAPGCVGVGEALLSGTGAHKSPFNFPKLIVLELGIRTLAVCYGPKQSHSNFE